MPYANTNYTPGMVHTQTSGMDTGFSQNPNSQLDALMKLKIKQMEDQMRRQAAPPKVSPLGASFGAAPSRPAMQAQAISPARERGPAPQQQMVTNCVKMIEGPGRVPGYVRSACDEPGAVASGQVSAAQAAHNQAQRPNNSLMSAAGGVDDAAREKRNADDFERFRVQSGGHKRFE